jgi:hypothetical protein|tara:strand:+ start:530 stop:760 length:231 start_codon:yes stop_codon:yes gene_type:complete
MAIKDDITVKAGSTIPVIDVETVTTIKHATTGKVYADEKEADDDVSNPETSTTKEDIVKDVAIKVNKLPDIFGGSS